MEIQSRGVGSVGVQSLALIADVRTGKQRKNRAKEFRGTAKAKGASKDKKK